jgi:hypothetical protein
MEKMNQDGSGDLLKPRDRRHAFKDDMFAYM